MAAMRPASENMRHFFTPSNLLVFVGVGLFVRHRYCFKAAKDNRQNSFTLW